MLPVAEKDSDTESVYEDAVDTPAVTQEPSTSGAMLSGRPQRIRKQTEFYQA